MKRFLFIAAVVLFVGCSQPVTTEVKVYQARHVMNSLWHEVALESTATGGRGVVDLEGNVAAYNASHIDDQWFIVDGEIPSIDDAPPCSIFIVDKATHKPVSYDDGAGGVVTLSRENWPRKSLVENYSLWVSFAATYNAELYIDVIPPAPAPPTEEQLYAKYSFYAIDSTGAIMYEEHGYPLQSGWPSLGSWETAQWNRFQLIVLSPDNDNTPWTWIHGQLYTAP